MTDRAFPVLWPYRRDEVAGYVRMGCPRAVPWDLVAPHEAQAMTNHGGQSLEVLASRGGLGPDEMVAVLEGRRRRSMPVAEAVGRLRELVAAHEPSP